LRRRIASEEEDLALCAALLPHVSRTFALTIRVLPPGLRSTVGVAYLMCRLADCLEDATGMNARVRVDALRRLGRALRPVPTRAGAEPDRGFAVEALADCFARLEGGLDSPGERRLFAARADVFRAFARLSSESQASVAHWIAEMADGMADFVAKELEELPRSSASQPIRFALRTKEEMERYAYTVAGTVGHLLTDLFIRELRLEASPRIARLRELAVPFGLGLQFTNIVQDLAEDRRRGWSYVPEDLAQRHGTTLSRLHLRVDRPAALGVVGDVIQEAARHLDAAMEFTLLLPRTAPRIRLFCAWPIFFAIRTLGRLWGNPEVLDGDCKVRISRSEVRRIIGFTSITCLGNVGLGRLYRRERERLRARMAGVPIRGV
jgi:farnesyl-diphosphate farnesyltransferase